MKTTKPYDQGCCLVCLFAYEQEGIMGYDQHHCSACNGVLCKGVVSCRTFTEDEDDKEMTEVGEIPEIGETTKEENPGNETTG